MTKMTFYGTVQTGLFLEQGLAICLKLFRKERFLIIFGYT
jgi:hypothetical protein